MAETGSLLAKANALALENRTDRELSRLQRSQELLEKISKNLSIEHQVKMQLGQLSIADLTLLMEFFGVNIQDITHRVYRYLTGKG